MNLNWSREKESKIYQGEEREGFTLTYIDHLNSILLFGGTHTRACDIYLYNLATKAWEVFKVEMPKPVPRKYHTAYYDKSMQALIIYGGEAEKGRSLQGFDILFLNERKWKRLSIKTPPPPRQFHTFTPIQGGHFLIFGGLTLPYGTFLNDLWILKKVKSLKETHTLEIPGCSCSEIGTKGSIPSGRYAHKAYAIENTFYVIGGESDEPEESFTIYSLNLSKLAWRKHNFNINLEQLVGFSLLKNPNSAAENQIYIFGGILSKAKKSNRFLYSIQLSESSPSCKKLDKVPDITSDILNNCCEVEESSGFCCSFSASRELVIYRCHPTASNETLSLEQYLKFIKNQQIISQQLLQKVKTLENLHREVQSFISNLYHNYRNSDDLDPEIEQEKREQIESCLALKSQYQKMELIYQENLTSMKQARRELAQINQYFEDCIETERDEDLGNHSHN